MRPATRGKEETSVKIEVADEKVEIRRRNVVIPITITEERFVEDSINTGIEVEASDDIDSVDNNEVYRCGEV